jgi:tRNA(fMet)-specific endonuclease VapC
VPHLLDTNHCSYLLNGGPGSDEKLAKLGDEHLATSVVVRGELILAAERSERRSENRARFLQFLAAIAVLPITETTADIYGDLKAAILDHFGPRERARRRHFTLAQTGISENDVWIAASAREHELIVVSGDRDFARMHQAAALVVEAWWPMLVR